MKNILFSILLILSISVSQAQTTSSTTTQSAALKVFEDAFITTDWSAKTTTEQDAFNRQWTGLKIAVAKENEVNRLAALNDQTAQQQAEQAALLAVKNLLIAKLQSLGYLCDNSATDWNKLYNNPALFGTNWQTQATYQKSISTSVDYFLSQAQSILFMPYEVGKYYKIGDTFIYAGDYYKVIQAHTSQRDWIPSTTASLYTKITAPATIATWKQPTGSSDAYKKGDKVTFNGSTYESLIDANVWSPSAYPVGWKKL